MMSRISRYSNPFMLAVAILCLTLMSVSTPSVGPDLPLDKVAHFGIFMLLAIAILSAANTASPRAVVVTIILCLVFGAGIEVTQNAMAAGRTAEIGDAIADALGVAVGVWIYIKYMHSPAISLAPVSAISPHLEQIYLSSFPEEERRPLESLRSLAATGGRFTVYEIRYDGRPVGLFTVWNFDDFYYLEHFAIDETMRGSGIGSLALKQLTTLLRRPTLIEVEPHTLSPRAARRLEFYRRNGFKSIDDYQYIQPPYAPGLPPVPLVLMVNGAGINPAKADALLRQYVYKST